MKKLIFALAGAALAAASAGAYAAPLTSAPSKHVLFVTEKITTDGVLTVKARTGPLTTSNEGYGINKMSTTLASSAIPVSMPKIAITGPFDTTTTLPTKGMVLDLAIKAVQNRFPAVRTGMTTYLKQYGMSSGWFNFKQDVDLDVAGVKETWTIYWDYFTDAEGRGAYPDPQVVPPKPKYLYVSYAQKAVDADLPADWVIPNAGIVKWQVRDEDFLPVGAEHTVDVNGLFDTPQGDTEYTDSGIKCLMNDQNAGCTAGQVNVRDLLDTSGAIMAVVDYARRVSPIWIQNADGTFSPQVAVSIDTRKVSYQSCTKASYLNEGRFGYALRSSVARYFATASTGSPRVVSYAMVKEYEGQYSSPTSSYTYSTDITDSQLPTLTSKSIDPIGADGSTPGTKLVTTTTIPGVVYTAPLDYDGDPSQTMGTYSTPKWTYDWDDHHNWYWWTISYKCDFGGGYSIDTTMHRQYYDNTPESYLTTTKVNNNAWTNVELYGHFGNRFSAMYDTGANRILVKNTFASYYEPKFNGEFWYADAHNNNSNIKTSYPSSWTTCSGEGTEGGTVCSGYIPPYSVYTSFGGWDLNTGEQLWNQEVIMESDPWSGG